MSKRNRNCNKIIYFPFICFVVLLFCLFVCYCFCFLFLSCFFVVVVLLFALSMKNLRKQNIKNTRGIRQIYP